MARKKSSRPSECPACGMSCAHNGTRGFCMTFNAEWQLMQDGQVDLKLKNRVDPNLFEVCTWVHSIVGKYIHPVRELWLATWTQEDNMLTALHGYYQLAFAFITYHNRKGLPVRSFEEERELVKSLVDALKEQKKGTEAAFLRKCYREPEGWAEEMERFGKMIQSKSYHWTPPKGLENWNGPTAA